MSIKHSLVILASLLVVQPVFADEDMHSDAKPCAAIVKACKHAGYTRHHGEGKQFWQDCMKPVVLGKTVARVKVDEKAVEVCRTAKISEMEQELSELKAAK